MPSEKNIKQVEELKEELKDTVAIFVTDFKGLTVDEINQVRRNLEKVNAKYKVVKNTLFKIAIKDTDFEQVSDVFIGTNGVVFVKNDIVETAKAVNDAVKNFENFKFKAGVVEGKAINEDDLKRLASLPSREILYAQLLSVMLGPVRGLVTVLSGVQRNFLYVLKAIEEKKGGN